MAGLGLLAPDRDAGVKSGLKKLVKDIAFRPRLGALGGGSYVLLPRKLTNTDRIFVGANATIHPYSIITPITHECGEVFQPRIEIADDVYIGRHTQLFCVDRIVLGRGTVLSDYVYISDSAHGYDPSAGLIMKQKLHSKGPITLGEHCFVGLGTTIMPGVTLGDWCIVGTRSVVTKSFPAYSMIGGAPARLIKQYSFENNAWRSPLD